MPFAPTLTLNPRQQSILLHVLQGGSVIDWPRLFLTTPEEAAAFLRINEFDVTRLKDTERLRNLHAEAVDYLRRELTFELEPVLLESSNILQFLLMASENTDPRLQMQACSLLKAMNIINHIDGRELLHNCPISLRDLFSLVEDKIEKALSSLVLGAGAQEALMVRFKGGRKPKESLITKLLCKRETIAAQIYDRVRYRIVTQTSDDIVRVILYLFDTVLPFNYVIPGVSVNQLLLLDRGARLKMLTDGIKRRLPSKANRMEYSGADYRVCKFVADVPVRMDKFLAASGSHAYRDSLGSIAYVLVEFQIVDEETDVLNNSGSSAHNHYKKRQKAGVLKRLAGKD
jgi:uncharacterized protein (TIGR04552 family)